MVLETLGRVDLLDASSFKNLRQVSTKLRDIVDGAGVTSKATFRTRAGAFGPLKAWAEGGPAIQRTRSFSIIGKVPPMLVGRLLMTMCNENPPISKMELHGVGEAGEVLLTGPLQQLRELTVTQMGRRFDALGGIVNNPSFVGLRVLRVEMEGVVDGAPLAAGLAALTNLKNLRFKGVRTGGGLETQERLKNSLPCLEFLELDTCSGFDTLGLLGAELPALRSLNLGLYSILDTVPCLGRLTSLTLRSARVTGPAVPAALHGGPLESLSLSGDYELAHWDWQGLSLPHLTSLEVSFPNSSDILGDVACAHLPALLSATLSFRGQTSAEGVHAFAAACTTLRDLTLQGHPQDAAEDVVSALSSEVVPLLERLNWTTSSTNAIFIPRNFLPKGPAGTAPAWPRLRSLGLQVDRLGSDAEQSEFFTSLARAAPHCNSLTSMKAKTCYVARYDAMEAFASAAQEVDAWPQLVELGLNWKGHDRARVTRMMRKVWTAATVECVYPGVN